MVNSIAKLPKLTQMHEFKKPVRFFQFFTPLLLPFFAAKNRTKCASTRNNNCEKIKNFLLL